jgi:hypothetical protein
MLTRPGIGAWMPATCGAHSVCTRVGYQPVPDPEWYMPVQSPPESP